MATVKRQRVIVMASGRGSNFEALARAEKEGLLAPFEIVALVCNQPAAQVRSLAKDFGIPNFLVDSTSFKSPKGFDRSSYEQQLHHCLHSLNPDWICLAGYMLVLGPKILRGFTSKILNIHPSLLPKYPGLRAQKQALEAGEKLTGCTVHFVNEELDGGPIILQKSIEILENDTEESLSRRLLPLEHQTYIEALQLLAKRCAT